MGITKQFYSRVAGVSYSNKDGTSRQDYVKKYCKPGLYLVLRPEPDNPEDPEATAVFVRTDKGDLQIGYITSDANRTVSSDLADGETVSAKITEITGGSLQKPTRGVNIEIAIGDQPSEAIQPKAVQAGKAISQVGLCLILTISLLPIMLCLIFFVYSMLK